MPINCSINFSLILASRFVLNINYCLFSVSFSYRSPIILLSFSYRSPIILLSFSYRSPIILLSFSYWGCGNNTETIRDWYGNNTESNGGWTNEDRWNKGGSSYYYRKFLWQWQDSNKLLGGNIYRRRQNPINPCRICLGFWTLYLTKKNR